MAESKPFVPAFWLRNSHLQTFWPFLFRFKPKPNYQRERIELPDGDFIDLDWLKTDKEKTPKATVLLIHGLQGCSQSHYIRGLADSLHKSNYQVVAINLRGRSGEMNREPVFYHAGYNSDIDFLIRRIKQNNPDTILNTIAASLGGSMLLNWLAQTDDAKELVNSAAVVSVPFLLASSAKKMEKGLSRIYQYHLVSSLKVSTKAKLAQMSLPKILPSWKHSKTFFEFDDAVTSRLHGFKDVNDYYQQASTKYKLHSIANPLLIIQSSDDPFMSDDVIPHETQINNNTTLEVYKNGGHVGFVGSNGCMPYYWLDHRIVAFFEQQI